MRTFTLLSILGLAACTSSGTPSGRVTTDDTYRVVDAEWSDGEHV